MCVRQRERKTECDGCKCSYVVYLLYVYVGWFETKFKVQGLSLTKLYQDEFNHEMSQSSKEYVSFTDNRPQSVISL